MFTSGWICPRLGCLFLKQKQKKSCLDDKILLSYQYIDITAISSFSWHKCPVCKRYSCSQGNIFFKAKFHFQGKSYSCWWVHRIHKQACIGIQVNIKSREGREVALLPHSLSSPSVVFSSVSKTDAKDCIFENSSSKVCSFFPALLREQQMVRETWTSSRGSRRETNSGTLWKDSWDPPQLNRKYHHHSPSPPQSSDVINIRQSTPPNQSCWTQENTKFPSNGTLSILTLRWLSLHPLQPHSTYLDVSMCFLKSFFFQ